MRFGLQSAALGAAKAASGDRVGVALRLLFPLALLEAALWSPQPLAILCGVSALWYITWHLYQDTSSIHGLGLGLRGLWTGSWLLGATFAISVATLGIAYYSGSLHLLWGLRHPWYAVLVYACWAFVQEFMLQCFFVRMLHALVSRAGVLLLSGVVFAIAHLPNISLTLLTFFAGIAFTVIYARIRNLYLVALIHAVLGLTVAVSAPDTWFHGLRVGRDFLEAPSTIAAKISPVR
jgi:hypothetical protein